MDFESLKPQIAEIARKHDLEFVTLFGSQARGNVHSKSDIDIAVISRSKIDRIKIISDFYDLFKRDDIEVVDLGLASPTMMMVVLKDDRLLYERNNGLFEKWKLYVIKIWMETAWLRDLRRKSLIEWAKNN